jgi:small GTP-binding protein
MRSRNKILMKVFIVGDSACGKTQLINNFQGRSFSLGYRTDSGADFDTHRTPGETLQIWWANEKAHKEAPIAFLRGTDVFILAIDLTNAQALESGDEWIATLKKEIYSDRPLPPLLLVGTKADLSEERQVSQETIFAFQKKHGIHTYIETSTKTEVGVQEVFKLAKKLGREKIEKDDREDSIKAQLQEKLGTYIERIKNYPQENINKNTNKFNFSYGLRTWFWFFYTKESQAFNREVNFKLAKKLKKELAGNTIVDTFNQDHIKVLRDKIVKSKRDPKNFNHIDRGINSKELNNIINKARSSSAR